PPGAACRNPGIHPSGQRRATALQRAGARRPAGADGRAARGRRRPRRSRTRAAVVSDRILPAAPFPASVRAFTTLRCGAGASAPPFDTFNLGNFRDAAGDDPAVVAGNRAELVARFGLPSWPHWLRQVHGTEVARFEEAARPPPQPSPARGGGSRSAAAAMPSVSGCPDLDLFPHAGKGGHGGFAATSGLPPPPRGGEDGRSGFAATSGLPPPPRAGEDGRSGFAATSGLPPPPRAGEGRGGGVSGGIGVSVAASPPLVPDEPEADAAVTATPGVVLAILTADCLPVVFAARDGDRKSTR